MSEAAGWAGWDSALGSPHCYNRQWLRQLRYGVLMLRANVPLDQDILEIGADITSRD
ncbi:hypothetical protein B0H15DRAFT_952216 [Mycena belliarum]|uniref:Uncharacterized protein n=1 Tax=Mycena belliarum TaxID=1033014 RepID=A0AAD6TZY2_9AGAR|nr:hypothetical protein B0H15DRAFT_952216 [Mycena belliae]